MNVRKYGRKVLVASTQNYLFILRNILVGEDRLGNFPPNLLINTFFLQDSRFEVGMLRQCKDLKSRPLAA